MTGAPSPLFGTSYFRERPREVQGEGALTPTIIEEGGQFLWLLFFFLLLLMGPSTATRGPTAGFGTVGGIEVSGFGSGF